MNMKIGGANKEAMKHFTEVKGTLNRGRKPKGNRTGDEDGRTEVQEIMV